VLLPLKALLVIVPWSLLCLVGRISSGLMRIVTLVFFS